MQYLLKMQVAVLSIKDEGTFIPNKLEANFDASSIFTKTKFSPRNLKLCARSCDGTYHIVNNDTIKEIANNRNIKSKSIGFLVSKLTPDEEVHGKRYLVYQNGKQCFLLGDTITALKKISRIN